MVTGVCQGWLPHGRIHHLFGKEPGWYWPVECGRGQRTGRKEIGEQPSYLLIIQCTMPRWGQCDWGRLLSSPCGKQVASKWHGPNVTSKWHGYGIWVTGKAKIKLAVKILGDQFIEENAERFCLSRRWDWLEVGIRTPVKQVGIQTEALILSSSVGN